MCVETSAYNFRFKGSFVRLLEENDAQLFNELCKKLPKRMLTPRLNVEVHGFQGKLTKTWGAFENNGETLSGVLMHYGNTMVAVDANGTCAELFAPIIDQAKGIAGIRGTREIIVGIQGLLNRLTPTDWQESYFMRLPLNAKLSEVSKGLARRATMTDLEPLAALYGAAGAMYRPHSNVRAKLELSRVFVADDTEIKAGKPRILSCALLNVEGGDAALIGGVYTLPFARGKGLASSCTSALCEELLRENKLPVLFYENPIAGRVYRSLGFEEIGRWAVIYVSPPEG